MEAVQAELRCVVRSALGSEQRVLGTGRQRGAAPSKWEST